MVPLLSFSIKLHPQGRMDCQKVDKQWKEWRMRLKLRELLELPSKEIVKSGTIRLTSDCRKAMEEERCPTIRKELDKCNTRLQFLADCLHFTPSGIEGAVSREEEKSSYERMSCCFRPKQKTMNFMQKKFMKPLVRPTIFWTYFAPTQMSFLKCTTEDLPASFLS